MREFRKQLEDGLVVIRELKSLPQLKDIISAHSQSNTTDQNQLNNSSQQNQNQNLPQDLQQQLEELYMVKIRSCCVLFDFSNDNNQYLEEKDIKRKTLLELIQYLEMPMHQRQAVLTEKVVQEVALMCSINLIRTPKVQVTVNGKIGEEGIENKVVSGDPDEEQIFLEESWPHIQIVYELLLRIIIQPSLDVKILKNHITQEFVLKLIGLFKSPDPRERDYLKTIIHRIYGKFMVYRSFIRKIISQQLIKVVVDEYEDQFGHSEYLEILGSIIVGFAVPLKVTYLEKDPSVADQCIRIMIKFWPILECTTNDVVEKVGLLIIKRLNKCINSDHFQVAERSLFMFNNDKLNWLLHVHKDKYMGIIIEGLMKNANQHWNATVQGLTFYVLKILVEIDSELFDRCSENYYNSSQSSILKRAKMDQKWRRCDQKAQSKSIR
eukprot:403367458